MTGQSNPHGSSEFASEYDAQVRDYYSYGHDVLFGICFEYVKAGDRLLDLAIGTGLASKPFADIGLRVSGLDISNDMLEACRTKGFAEDLRRHDLELLKEQRLLIKGYDKSTHSMQFSVHVCRLR